MDKEIIQTFTAFNERHDNCLIVDKVQDEINKGIDELSEVE
jgi:hypothetical protein